MRCFAPVLLVIVASSWAIDVDHDESTLGVGLYNSLKDEDPKTVTESNLKAQTIAFMDLHKHMVTRMLTNALNEEIMSHKGWKTWQDMVNSEAKDVAEKEGQLEDFTDELKKVGKPTAQEITTQTIIEYFSPIAEQLANDPKVGLNHNLSQQE